jgi:hypothetical protein
MKNKFVVTYAIRRTEIPALLNTWVTNAPSVKILSTKKNCYSSFFLKIMTCLNVESVTFSVFCKTVYPWVTTNCCFMRDICNYQYSFCTESSGTLASVCLTDERGMEGECRLLRTQGQELISPKFRQVHWKKGNMMLVIVRASCLWYGWYDCRMVFDIMVQYWLVGPQGRTLNASWGEFL